MMTHQNDFLARLSHKTRKFTKDDIGEPFDFNHVAHIAFDRPNGYFCVINKESDTCKENHAMYKNKLRKSDISEPRGFVHTEHVGGGCFVCDGNCPHKAVASRKTETDGKGAEMKRREEIFMQPLHLGDI